MLLLSPELVDRYNINEAYDLLFDVILPKMEVRTEVFEKV